MPNAGGGYAPYPQPGPDFTGCGGHRCRNCGSVLYARYLESRVGTCNALMRGTDDRAGSRAYPCAGRNVDSCHSCRPQNWTAVNDFRFYIARPVVNRGQQASAPNRSRMGFHQTAEEEAACEMCSRQLQDAGDGRNAPRALEPGEVQAVTATEAMQAQPTAQQLQGLNVVADANVPPGEMWYVMPENSFFAQVPARPANPSPRVRDFLNYINEAQVAQPAEDDCRCAGCQSR